VALCNQLLAQLGVCFPGAVGLFGDLHSGVAGAFLRRYPTAARAASLTEASLAAFLRRILSRHERQGTNRLVGEDAVAAELELTGTNTGPMMMAGKKIPPTGKSVAGKGAYFARVEEGKVISTPIPTSQA